MSSPTRFRILASVRNIGISTKVFTQLIPICRNFIPQKLTPVRNPKASQRNSGVTVAVWGVTKIAAILQR